MLLFKAGKGIESAAENGFNPYATRILRFVAIIPSGHSYAVAAIRAGDDMKTVSSNLGHTTISITMDIYASFTDDMATASANRMNAYISANF